jgi:hypothetical protein
MVALETPGKIITYRIAHDESGGALFLYGSAEKVDTKEKKKVALCCAGFPDDHGSFIPLASRLAREQDCLARWIRRPPRKAMEESLEGRILVRGIGSSFQGGSQDLDDGSDRFHPSRSY